MADAGLFGALRARLSLRPGRTLNLPGVQLREAAVLVPLFERDGRAHALFTKRPPTLRSHAGQISFPGGGREPGDPTPLHTALREAEEELGIPPARVEVLGMLNEIPTITQYRITPFVGVIPGDLLYRPSPEEIEEVIEVPLRELMDPAIHRVERISAGREREGERERGVGREIYSYDYGPHVIWGATARIVRDLLSLLTEILPSPDPDQEN